jgi:YidC/Oxa1 family membrane protein insertase
MTNNIRIFLWVGLALALYVNYSQWQLDYGPKPTPVTATAPGNAAPDAPKPSALDETVPQVAQQPATAAGAAAPPLAEAAPTTAAVESPGGSAALVRVTTDVLIVDIDLKGGTLVYAELPGYPVVKGGAQSVVLLNRASPATAYVLQTGLTGLDADDVRPTHLAKFDSAASSYSLAPGQQELRVPLTWSDGQGVTVTKTFIFRRSMFGIGLEYSVDNKSAAPWSFAAYSQISRADPKVERSMFKVETLANRGPAIWAPQSAEKQKNVYELFDIEDTDEQTVAPKKVERGWLAGLQHHFVTAVVPDQTKPQTFSMRSDGRQYLLTALGPQVAVAPGSTVSLAESLYVGPKLQKQLVSLHEDLDHVADYGWLYLIAKPLFLLLAFAHGIVHNWGVAIIIATLLLKLLFYPLSEKAGRSMARMRTLTPRLKQLQENYKGDRAKLGQATMELYRNEKVNPVAGCLPMLIQAPVFLAFYWVLLESAEMRQAPFLGWINDLSSRDPYFILPVLNGVAMWFQQKLNPPPPDPMQARLFQFMPVVFTVMFALFPAGLVLYWVTNTALTILQQWNINRKIEAEEKARKR